MIRLCAPIIRLLIVAALFASRPALASVSTWYAAGDFCMPDTSTQAGEYQWYGTGSDGWGIETDIPVRHMVCPVVKTTSYPGAGYLEDDIFRIDFDVKLSAGANITCHFDVLTTVGTSNNLVQPYSVYTSQPGRSTISIQPTYPPSQYWGNSSGWKYPQIWCVSGGSGTVGLVQYWVWEHGTDYGLRIYPASIGRPDPDMSCHAVLPVGGTTSGYVESRDVGFFKWAMGVWGDNNTIVDIAFSKNFVTNTYFEGWPTTTITQGVGPQSLDRLILLNVNFNNGYWGFYQKSDGAGDSRLWSVRSHN